MVLEKVHDVKKIFDVDFAHVLVKEHWGGFRVRIDYVLRDRKPVGSMNSGKGYQRSVAEDELDRYEE